MHAIFLWNSIQKSLLKIQSAWYFSQKSCQPIVLSFMPSRENRIGLNWIRSSIDFQFSYRHGIIFSSFIFFWQNFLYLQCHHAKLAFLNKKKMSAKCCWLQLTLSLGSFLTHYTGYPTSKCFSLITDSAVLLKMVPLYGAENGSCEMEIWYSTTFDFGK